MMDKVMKTTIIRIGNSKGILIPASLIKKLGIKDKDQVTIVEKDGCLELSFSRQEEPFTGPFTGPFAELAQYRNEDDPWGDPVEYVRQLRDETGYEKRQIPQWP